MSQAVEKVLLEKTQASPFLEVILPPFCHSPISEHWQNFACNTERRKAKREERKMVVLPVLADEWLRGQGPYF
jgi:hypothetical protein